MKLRTLIVDDERLARRELRRLLRADEHVDIVGEAASAAEARTLLDRTAVDLLFLDIAMPGETGFDLLESLECVPQVIFTTAYDDFALEAFRVNALDYLVKPVEEDRLVEALSRAHAVEVRAPSTALQSTDRVFVRDGSRCWIIELARVLVFEAEGNYVRVVFDEGRPLIRRSMNDLERRLSPEEFFRASRSRLVNMAYVKAVEPLPDGRLLLRLEGDHEVEVSRRQARVFRERNQL